MKKIIFYIVLLLCIIAFVFLKNYAVYTDKISFNKYKLTCWLCDDFNPAITNICDERYGWVVMGQYLGRFNIERSITVSCKDSVKNRHEW